MGWTSLLSRVLGGAFSECRLGVTRVLRTDRHFDYWEGHGGGVWRRLSFDAPNLHQPQFQPFWDTIAGFRHQARVSLYP